MSTILNSEDLNIIEKLISSGQHTKAKLGIYKILREKKVSTDKKVQVFNILKRLGENSKALRILGRELSLNELQAANTSQLKVQLQLAEMLNFIGAKYVAKRIITNITKVQKERGNDLSKSWNRYNFILGDIFYSWGDYKNAERKYKLALKSYSKSDYLYKLIFICLCDTIEAQGESDLAISKLKEHLKTLNSDEIILEAISYQALGEYSFRKNKYKEAEKYLKLSEKIFGKDVNTKDYAYLKKWFGALYIETGRKELSKKPLDRAYQILSNHKSQPMALIEVLYWKNLKQNKSLTLADTITLNCYHDFSSYLFLNGRQKNSNQTLPLHYWAEKKYKANSKDCWIISDKKLTMESYSKIKANENDLDLYCGLFRGQILSSLQIYCLIGLVSSGSLGVNEWALIDFIYRENFYDPAIGKERLKKLLKQIKKYKLNFKVKDLNYTFDYSNEFRIILPMNLSPFDIIHYFKKYKTEFTRKDLEQIFNIKQTKAKEILSRWKQQAAIKTSGSGKSITYTIKIRS